ncbi:hypothetical protein E2C01_091398 [Portunus trituberculatus]|uniref:Uncharacterized protein n=1 Tax=Portunus trituberculatus TaxID=210409 RepID=A0A5B7JPA1_PORTR|nr:hypothetical protein [Portunus trituberculatus]
MSLPGSQDCGLNKPPQNRWRGNRSKQLSEAAPYVYHSTFYCIVRELNAKEPIPEKPYSPRLNFLPETSGKVDCSNLSKRDVACLLTAAKQRSRALSACWGSASRATGHHRGKSNTCPRPKQHRPSAPINY